MDMQDPRPEELQAAPENPTPEAEAPAAEAGMTSTAVSEDAEPDAKPEIEVELLMSDAEEEAEEQATPVRQELTLESLLALAHELQEKEAGDLSMDEIRRLRQQTAMLHKPAAVAEDAEGAQGAPTDPVVVEINSIIEALRTRKAEWTAAQEAARAENLRIKNEIIEQIIALAEDTDNVNRTFPRYLELQEQFNTTGDVAPTEETSLWKRFQEARERYSDNLKINKELRDYDFKKNLTEKETLLEEATALSTEEDVIGAYRRLQELHNRWRQIGPVAKELRDEIWNKFRDASAEVNKRYQAFFEARKAREAENEAGKTALCEKIEAIDCLGDVGIVIDNLTGESTVFEFDRFVVCGHCDSGGDTAEVGSAGIGRSNGAFNGDTCQGSAAIDITCNARCTLFVGGDIDFRSDVFERTIEFVNKGRSESVGAVDRSFQGEILDRAVFTESTDECRSGVGIAFESEVADSVATSVESGFEACHVVGTQTGNVSTVTVDVGIDGDVVVEKVVAYA